MVLLLVLPSIRNELMEALRACEFTEPELDVDNL